MKFRPRHFFILVIIGLMVYACELTQLDDPFLNGDEEEKLYEPTTIPGSIEGFEELFHGGSEKEWLAVSFTLAGLDGFQDCRLDDKLLVRSDGTYLYDGGDLLCGAEDSQKFMEGTWKVINNGNNLLFDEGTVRAYTATVNGLETGTISVSGHYIGLSIKGIYITD